MAQDSILSDGDTPNDGLPLSADGVPSPQAHLIAEQSSPNASQSEKPGQLALSPDDLQRAVESAFTSKEGSDGWCRLADAGNSLKSRHGFEPWRYGYLTLAKFLDGCGMVEIQEQSNGVLGHLWIGVIFQAAS